MFHDSASKLQRTNHRSNFQLNSAALGRQKWPYQIRSNDAAWYRSISAVGAFLWHSVPLTRHSSLVILYSIPQPLADLLAPSSFLPPSHPTSIIRMSDTGYAKPLATLLREGTMKAHETAENSVGAGWLLRGELDKEEYARFLMMLWHVYE